MCFAMHVQMANVDITTQIERGVKCVRPFFQSYRSSLESATNHSKKN